MSSRAAVRKLQQPARRRKSAAARFGWRLATALVLAAAIGGATAWLAVRESADPKFRLTTVAVTGTHRSMPREIVAEAGLPRGENIWLMSISAAAERIGSDPRIRSVAVHRVWPNRIRIEVAERQAVARVRLQASAEDPTAQADFALVDAGAHVIAVGPLAAQDDALPVLALQSLPGAASRAGSDLSHSDVAGGLDALARVAALGIRCSEMDIDRASGLSAITDAGIRVDFGSLDQLDKKVSLYRTIVSRLPDTHRVRSIDLRSTSAPTVLFY